MINIFKNNNTINNSNSNTKIIAKNILNKKVKKENEVKGKSSMPAKVINNTTNINIINYNCYNNSPSKNNIQIPNKILNISQKNQFKNLTNQDSIDNIAKDKEINTNLNLFNSNENFYRNKNNNLTTQKKINNFTKSMISFNNININNKNNSKKSSSMNKIENDYSNMGISQKILNFGISSLSQGKDPKKKLKFNKEITKPGNNTFYNVNLNIIHNNRNNFNFKNNHSNNNLLSLLNKG